jgi:hypothetical protein
MEVEQNILGIINRCPIELRPTTAFAHMLLQLHNKRRFVVMVSVGYCDNYICSIKSFIRPCG